MNIEGTVRWDKDLSFPVGKDLWIYGQNTQIAKYIVGGLKNPYSFTDTQYFLDFFYEIIFLWM